MADEDVFGFGIRDVDRIARAVRTVEAGRRPAQPASQVPNWQHVTITGPVITIEQSDETDLGSDSDLTANDLDYYPGIVVMWSAPDQSDLHLAKVWVLDRNKQGLSIGQDVAAMQSGDLELPAPDESDSDTHLENRPLFTTAASGTSDYVFLTQVVCVELIDFEESDSVGDPP